MRLATIPMLIAPLLGLTACLGSSAASVRIEAPPPILMQPGPALSASTGRGLTQSEVEVLWGHDRAAARISQDRHKALIAWVQGLIEATGNAGGRGR